MVCSNGHRNTYYIYIYIHTHTHTHTHTHILSLWASPVAQTVKNLQAVWRHGFDPWNGKFPWRRKRQPTPVILPGKSHGQRSLVGYSPWGHKKLDMTEWLTHTHTHTQFIAWNGREMLEHTMNVRAPMCVCECVCVRGVNCSMVLIVSISYTVTCINFYKGCLWRHWCEF